MYVILAYFGVAIRVFDGFPVIFPDTAVPLIIAGCAGWLWREYSADDSDFMARHRSPRVLCSFGDYSWDGVTRSANVDGEPYFIYYLNGCNYDGTVYQGDVALAVPQAHVVEFGKNRVVQTDLGIGSLSSDVALSPVKAVLTGSMVSPVFSGKYQDVDVTRQYQSATLLSNLRGHALDEIMKLFSDASMLGRILHPNDDLEQKLLTALKDGDED